MGHDYGVSLRVLSITPTRDNDVAPGNRLADKHSRLFCGKTLDEWTMLQLWSSKSNIKKVFVCETIEHAGKMELMAHKYEVELMVRPRDMLHPMNDTGCLPIVWAGTKQLQEEYYTLVTTPLVVSPCRPPGFFDYMIDEYCSRVRSPDYERNYPVLTAAWGGDADVYNMVGGRGKPLGEPYLNKNENWRFTNHSHWIGAGWWYAANYAMIFSRQPMVDNPMLYDIEPWMDIHIDTEDHWKEAEFWFREKILSKGEDCYESYRRGE